MATGLHSILVSEVERSLSQMGRALLNSERDAIRSALSLALIPRPEAPPLSFEVSGNRSRAWF